MEQLFKNLADQLSGIDIESRRLWLRYEVPSRDTETTSHFAEVEGGLLAPVLNSLVEGLLITDTSRKLKVFNEAAMKLFGGDVLEIGSPAWRETFVICEENGAPLAETDCPFQKTLDGEPLDSLLLIFKTPSRPEGFFVELNSRPIRDKSSRVFGSVFLIKDVSAQKKERERLEITTRRFETLAHLINDMIWEWDGNRDETWRHSSRGVFGYPAEIIYDGQTWWKERVHPDDQPKMERLFRTVMDGYQSEWKAEYRFRRADETYSHVIDHGKVVAVGPDNKPMHLMGAMIDISERKNTEAKLAELAAIVETTDDAIIRDDLDGNIQSWNPGATTIYGYSAAEMENRSYEVLVPPDELETYRALKKRVLNGERIGRQEGWRVTKSGQKIIASETFTSIRSPSGRVTGCCSIGRNVTEPRLLQEQMKTLANNLARSNEDLKQFAYVASHDLREPLRTITSFADLLRNNAKTLDASARGYLDLITDGAARMDRLTKGLLDYSKAEHSQLERKRVDCAIVVQTVKNDLRTSLEECGAELLISPLPTIYGDEILLRQLIQNLVSNAVKFRKSHAPKIAVNCEEIAGEWRISVQDNGIGIAPEFSREVFKLFRRLNSVGDFPGAGLGLSTCEKIVERHGGRIWLESKLGEGTTFHFTIPKN